MSLSEVERERDFYRQQCDALGERLLAMQVELTQAQREARQALTTVQLIREGYQLLAVPNTPLKEISRRFLRIILSKMGADRAAFLRYLPGRGAFLCDDLLGFPDSEWPAFIPPSTPGAFHFLNSRSTTDPLLDCLREAAGTPYLLWAFDQQARYALLLGNHTEDQHRQRSFEERDREIVGGMLSAYLGIARRKQAEEALRASEKRYYLLFEMAPDAYYMTDLEGTVLDCNRAAEAQIGARRDEIIGRHILKMGRLPPAQVPGALSLLEQSALGRDTGPTQFTINRKDGSQVEVEVSTFPVKIQTENLVLGIAHDITERVQAEAEVKARLEEKEVLLKEIHHRVKNNLQVISSLLNLQSSYTPDEATQALFQESRGRVRAMALVHEHLYRSDDLCRVNFSDYVQVLIDQMALCHNLAARQIDVQIDIDDMYLPIDIAIPCGLIINELTTNAFKHAFPDGGTGEVHIELSPTESDQLTLVVSDNGVGLPEGFDLSQTTSLGLQLVATLIKQLTGTVQVDGDGETVFEIVFPNPDCLANPTGTAAGVDCPPVPPPNGGSGASR